MIFEKLSGLFIAIGAVCATTVLDLSTGRSLLFVFSLLLVAFGAAGAGAAHAD